MERRVGKALFREMLGLHFSSRRPEVLPGSDQWTEYPIMTVVVEVVERARERGEVHPDASALPTAQLFMIGLYAMLIASHEYPKAARAEILDNFMATVLRGVAPAEASVSPISPAPRCAQPSRPVPPRRRAQRSDRSATRSASLAGSVLSWARTCGAFAASAIEKLFGARVPGGRARSRSVVEITIALTGA
jgi:hypothetical protein